MDDVITIIGYIGFGFVMGFITCLKQLGDLSNTINASTNKQSEIFDAWTKAVTDMTNVLLAGNKKGRQDNEKPEFKTPF